MAYFQEGSEAMEQLEAMIDKVGPRNVAWAVATICEYKAAHLEESWQDRNAARIWERCAKAWNAAAAKLPDSPLE